MEVVLEVLVVVLLGIRLFVLHFYLLAEGFPGLVYNVLLAVVPLVPVPLLFVPVLLLTLVLLEFPLVPLLASPFPGFFPAYPVFALCRRCLPIHLFLVFAVLSSLLLLASPLASLLGILCSWHSPHLFLLMPFLVGSVGLHKTCIRVCCSLQRTF